VLGAGMKPDRVGLPGKRAAGRREDGGRCLASRGQKNRLCSRPSSWNDPAPRLGGRVRHWRGLHTLRHRGGRFDCSGGPSPPETTVVWASGWFALPCSRLSAACRLGGAESKHGHRRNVRPHGPQNRGSSRLDGNESLAEAPEALHECRGSGCALKRRIARYVFAMQKLLLSLA
jgi:hypothetical protein